MVGNFLRDFKLVRVVGEVTVSPQAAATASSILGLGIVRTRHSPSGAISGGATSYSPLDTDTDSFSLDWLYRRISQPAYGGPLDATALDFAASWPIDIRGRPTLRVMEKIHGLQLMHVAETTARIQITVHLRILINKL